MRRSLVIGFLASMMLASGSALAQEATQPAAIAPEATEAQAPKEDAEPIASSPAIIAPAPVVEATPAPAPAPTPYVMDQEQRKYLYTQPAVIVVEKPHHPRRWHLGGQIDIGAPSGITASVVFNPWVEWLRLGAGLSDNVLHTGGRFNLQLDPLGAFHNLPVGIFGDLQYGWFPRGSIPGHSSDLPSIGYDYESLLGGLRFGKPGSGFKFLLEGGTSHVSATSANFQSVVNQHGGSSNGLVIGDPRVSGWFSPAADVAFLLTF